MLLAALCLTACSDGRPASGNLAPGAAGRTAPTAAMASPLPAGTSLTDACGAYRRALDLATPYARTGTLTTAQNSAIAYAVQEAGPVCMRSPPDPRYRPVVDASLASLANAGIPVR